PTSRRNNSRRWRGETSAASARSSTRSRPRASCSSMPAACVAGCTDRERANRTASQASSQSSAAPRSAAFPIRSRSAATPERPPSTASLSSTQPVSSSCGRPPSSRQPPAGSRRAAATRVWASKVSNVEGRSCRPERKLPPSRLSQGLPSSSHRRCVGPRWNIRTSSPFGSARCRASARAESPAHSPATRLRIGEAGVRSQSSQGSAWPGALRSTRVRASDREGTGTKADAAVAETILTPYHAPTPVVRCSHRDVGIAPGRPSPEQQEEDMRIILSDFISLDGVVQAPGGKDEDRDGGLQHGGWSMPLFDPEAMGAVVGEVMDRTDALLFGRRTWDVMAAAWPERAGDPYADQMNSIRKYVVSRTLSPEEASSRWNNTALL